MPKRATPMAFIEPMAATQVAELPRGPEWSYEVKLDGYRSLALKDGDRVRLLSRKNKDLTRDFPSVASAVGRIRATTALLDGEIVAVDADGVPRFQALHHRTRTRSEQIVYYAFDLLHLADIALMARPLEERRQHLAASSVIQGCCCRSRLLGDVRTSSRPRVA